MSLVDVNDLDCSGIVFDIYLVKIYFLLNYRVNVDLIYY